ncbi:hypothetical protein QMP26_19490 [Enterocloster clostridioformis]
MEAFLYARNNPDNIVVHNKVKLLYSDLTGFNPDSCICFCVILKSMREEKVIMDIGFSGIFKLWVNNQPLCAGNEYQQRKFIELTLQPDENIVIIEYINQRENVLAHGYIQVYNYNDAINGKIFPKLDKIISNKRIEVLSQFDPDSGVLEYMLLCSPDTLVQSQLVKSNITEIKRKYLRGMIKYQIDLAQYKDIIFNVGLRICAADYVISLAVILPKKQLDCLCDMAEEYRGKCISHREIMIKGICKKLKKTYLSRIRQYELTELLYCTYHQLPIKTNRNYFVSDIDLSVQEVVVKLPEDYDKNKAYPLVFNLVDKEEELFSESISDCREYILADYYCGGILGGGYMCEARYLEVLDYMCSKYIIDKNRIFLVGQSHSSFDLWSLVENHPDLATAAFCISGSPGYDNIMNVSNLPITNVLSNFDYNYLNKMGMIRELLHSDNYYEIRCNNIISASLSDFTLYSVLDFFDGKSKDYYPRELHFTTTMNRYLRSYWIKTYGISYGTNYLHIHAIIISSERIEIEVENTVGFQIELPIYISKEKFVVSINQVETLFENYTKSIINFFNDGNRYLQVDEWTQSIDYRKGIGVLDVYLAPLRIYIERNHTRVVYETAKNFSSPLSNGIISKLDISYPIDYIENFNADQNNSNSIIFIHINNIALELKKHYGNCLELPISTNADSFEYKDTCYFGEYCIMQIIANPNNSERSIMLIQTNDESLLHRNFLTRNVIIPFMFNGFHPYYHNEAVIMYEKRYYSIFEWGNEMKEIL